MYAPLSGVRVVDRTRGGDRMCATILADLGADVVCGGALDERVDAVLVSGRPPELRAHDLDPAVLLVRHPHLIVAALSPFGLDGPRAEWRSCDTVAQALGGMLAVNGHLHEPPLRGLGLQAYRMAGVHAAIGVVLALFARRATGRGQVIDVSAQESSAAAVEHVTGLYRERGIVAGRQGTLHWSGTFRVAQCLDGPVLLSHLGDWTALLEWVKADGAAEDLDAPCWADAQVRRAQGAHLFDVLARWAARSRRTELVEQAQLRRLPFAPVWSLADLARHPQLWARGFFVRAADGPGVRRGGPFRFDATREGDVRTGREHAADAGATRPETGAAPGMAEGVLRGVRVVDLTWVVAGPVATRVLADHGADVVKIERLDAPDGPERRGGSFGNLNRGKRSLAVDLGDPRGVALVRKLALQADVVIDNFSPRVMANWGLDAAALRAHAPQLIVVSLSGFGASGPLADHVSYGPTLQAQSGWTWHMRHPGGAPAGWGFSYSDMASGYCTALAVLAALWKRCRANGGCHIDLSQLEILASMLGGPLADALAGRAVPDAFGNRSPEGSAAPDGVYRCRDAGGRDRWVALAVFDDDEWRRFVAALGHPTWASDARFASASERMSHAAMLDGLVTAWTRQRSAEAVMAALQAAGIAAGVVADARDLTADPQLAARGYWRRLPGGIELDGVVPRLLATPGAVRSPGPRLGEHTEQVLRDLLGMKQSAVDRLRRDGVVR